MRGSKKNKFYVVTYGKCPGIYDDWQRVQQQIDGFKGGEYCSKSSKAKAIDFFQEKRPDWPKHNIPDFTLRASNRLVPLDNALESVDGGGSNALLKAPTHRDQLRPEKIVLQQNWLEAERSSSSLSTNSRRAASRRGRSGRSQSLTVPSLQEAEFNQRSLSTAFGMRPHFGLKSPAPQKPAKGDFNFPMISPASSPTIELFPNIHSDDDNEKSRRRRRKSRGKKATSRTYRDDEDDEDSYEGEGRNRRRSRQRSRRGRRKRRDDYDDYY